MVVRMFHSEAESRICSCRHIKEIPNTRHAATMTKNMILCSDTLKTLPRLCLAEVRVKSFVNNVGVQRMRRTSVVSLSVNIKNDVRDVESP